MYKAWKFKSVIKFVSATVLATIVVLLLPEIWGAWTVPNEYPFGAEGPAAQMWAYDSQQNYLTAMIATWTTAVLALWALFAKRRSPRTRILCAIPFAIVWALMAYDGSRLV